MDSKVADEHCNTETEEGTVARQKKRSRRVSFAENTSVHFFDREENETPPDFRPSSSDKPSEFSQPGDDLGFFQDSSDANESSQNEEDDAEELDPRRSFLRPIESPSSGSIIGSATSNDDFFGPVSASFIRPGRLSDSAASDENHDVTMDSTFFSMHFRSLARSDTGGDIKTSTGVHLSFEEKTPTQVSVPTSLENSMVLTVAKKPTSQDSIRTAKFSSGNDSNDMSLFGQKRDSYDFGRLSPRLDALLAEGCKDLHAVSISDNNSVSVSPRNMEGNFVPSIGFMDLSDDGDNVTGGINTRDMATEVVPVLHSKLSEANGGPKTSPICQITRVFSSNTSGSPVPVSPSLNELTRGKPVGRSEESVKNASEMRRHGLGFPAVSHGTLSDLDKCKSPSVLPSHFTWSGGKKTQPNVLTSEDHNERTLVTSGTDSLLTEITLEAIAKPNNFVSSLEKRIITSPEYQGSVSRELRLPVQYNTLVKFGPGQDAGSGANVINASLLTSTTDKLDSSLMEMGAQSSPLITETSQGLSEVEMMDDREIYVRNLQDTSGTMRNFPTPVRDKDSQNIQSIIPDWNFQTGRDMASFEIDLPGGEINAATCVSTSPFALGSVDEPSFQKNLLEWFTQSPSRKELCNVTHADNIYSFVAEDVLSPKSNQLTNGLKNSSARKRISEDIILRDRGHMDEIASIQRSPKLHKGGVCDSEFLECQNESNSETSSSGHELKHWADIYSKFSGDTKQLLSSSVDKLNFCAIDALEDILIHLQRSKTYEMLCTEIQSQKIFDPTISVQHKRVAETRLFLRRILHEQVKLQLMLVKRERLLRKVQLLSSGIQESQMLKLSYLPRLSVGIQVDDDHFQPSEDIQEVAYNKMTAMGQALEASERRITNLTKSFHTSCKMEGEPGYADTIVLVNDHLVKRTRHQFIRLDSQLWVVESLESRNDHHIVVLNYLGLNMQRLKINVGPTSSIFISNKLNEINIVKNLPDMDACTALSFVLIAEATRKYVCHRSLAQETQISSSLFGNLLDVFEEVQQARVELRNLTQTCFHSPSAAQLDLQLCFFDFKSCRKATLTLDMSCLERGLYPSEIIPSQVAVSADGTQNSFSQQLFAEIRDAVQSLRAGYMRIIRLCRCVSQVVQASSG